MVSILLWATIATIASAADDAPPAEFFAQHAQPFLARHCLSCHAGVKPKGDFRLDRLSDDFSQPAALEQWNGILERLQSGEMPPKEKPRPPAAEVKALSTWITSQAQAAETARQKEGRVVLRRLNRVEYENTIRDLLAIEVDLQELLPADTSAAGFDNNAEALHTSSFLMDSYLAAADKALDLAIANTPQPPTVLTRYHYKDEHQIKNDQKVHAADNRNIFRVLDDGVVFFSSTYSPTNLSKFYPRIRGHYRFRISAVAFQSPADPVTFSVRAGSMSMAGKSHLVGYYTAPEGEPTKIEFVERIEPTHTITIVPYGTGNEQEVRKEGANHYTGAGLKVEWVEVEGPLHDVWPPASHRRIFGDLPQGPAPIYNQRDRLEVISSDAMSDARTVLLRFCRRAFRREVSEADITPFLNIFTAKLAEDYSFEQSLRVALKGVLVSPAFLFLQEKPGALDDFALASRLSYFLWSTMPDEELIDLAAKGKLSEPAVLHEQVERLLKSEKSNVFVRNFVDQWLGLRDIDFTIPDRLYYPEYDDMLKTAMVQEAHLFFTEVLTSDLSLTNFVASDFTILNERLARHYGIEGVTGFEFRKVPLPPGSHRGGVMTMAGVLKVTANGTSTSPVVRGAWVLDRIRGTPPSPPPAGVPAVEPDIRGATTIREQLAKHRSIGACASCHVKIDPPGFALESFDVIGGWRENYRSRGGGRPVTIDGKRMTYNLAQAVEPADELADGRAFQNVDEFKELLLADKDALARALAGKLLTYATGQPPRSADEAEIAAIVARNREKNYGLRSLIHEVVDSQVFHTK